MSGTIQGLITEAKRNKYSLIPTLSEEDVVSIWEVVSWFIENQMMQQKGVTIHGLGTFTFSQKKIDVGSNKFIVIQRPVFVLSERFAQTHSLKYTKQHISGQIPIMPLNFTILANETPFNRDAVEMCVKEVLQALERTLAARKNVEFDFSGIGRLIIRENRVKMRFFREFINTLDSSGDMESAFRPDTARSELSIMSNPYTPRPSTSGSFTLPKIVEPSKNGFTLNLECSTPRLSTSSGGSTKLSGSPSAKMPSICEEEESEENGEDSMRGAEIAQGVEGSGTSPPLSLGRRRNGSRQLTPKPAGLFARDSIPSAGSIGGKKTAGEVEKRKSSGSSPKPHFAVRPSTCSHSSSAGQDLCYLCHQRAIRNVPVDVSKERSERERVQDQLLQEYQHQKDLIALAKEQATKTSNRIYNKEMASFNYDKAEKKRVDSSVKSSEIHPSYVFQYRALTPAKHLKQMDYCVQLDEQVNHKLAHLHHASVEEEKMEREEQQQLSKELAAYQEAHRREEAAKVAQYQKALAEQVAIKHELSSLWSKLSPIPSNASTPISSTHCHDSSASGSRPSTKLRPLSLPKPTIILPFSHTKTMTILKDGKMKMIRMKPTTLSPVDADANQQPVFGIHDVSTEKLKDRERERALFLEQLAMVSERQAIAREKGLRAQQEEADMLKSTRDSLIEDMKTERKAKFELRRSLEDTWKSSNGEKQRRLLEDLQYAKEPSILLHQQCEKYHRCKQCQRRRRNCGKSNLLCESRYISGSRLMV